MLMMYKKFVVALVVTSVQNSCLKAPVRLNACALTSCQATGVVGKAQLFCAVKNVCIDASDNAFVPNIDLLQGVPPTIFVSLQLHGLLVLMGAVAAAPVQGSGTCAKVDTEISIKSRV